MSDWNPVVNWFFSTKPRQTDVLKPEESSAPVAIVLTEGQAEREDVRIDDARTIIDRVWDGLTKETCPMCDRSGGQRTSQRHIGFEQRPGIVTEEERHYDRHGNCVRTTERDVHVMKRIKIYDQRYRCYICHHDWECRMERCVTD